MLCWTGRQPNETRGRKTCRCTQPGRAQRADERYRDRGIALWHAICLFDVVGRSPSQSPDPSAKGGAPQRTACTGGSQRWAFWQRAALDTDPRTRGESGVAQVKDMRGTIKTVNDRQLVLEAPGTPPTDYAFDLNGCTIRRGQRQTGPSDLVGGDTVGVLYVESGGKLIARMILVPGADTRR